MCKPAIWCCQRYVTSHTFGVKTSENCEAYGRREISTRCLAARVPARPESASDGLIYYWDNIQKISHSLACAELMFDGYNTNAMQEILEKI